MFWGVGVDNFVPVSFNFVPYLRARELCVEPLDHDVTGVRPAIPDSSTGVSAWNMVQIAADILSQDDPGSGNAALFQLRSMRGMLHRNGRGPADSSEFVAWDGAIWVDGPSIRPDETSHALDRVGIEMDLPQIWRMAWTNGSVFMDADGDVFLQEAAEIYAAETLALNRT